MKLLMHICCANCALFPLQSLREGSHEITGLWFNPNIHPEDEYERRQSAVRQLSDEWDLRVLFHGGYGRDEFDRAMEANCEFRQRPGRCGVCYGMRMRHVASECATGGFDAFTTSLLVSPYQDHGLLAASAEEAALEFGVKFHYEDFRPGWRQGQVMSREAGFYRQYYCGCAYSKAERDAERSARSRNRRTKMQKAD